jgi:aryl-alcohol dehydrogenase-like predicted oxidoreductase
MIQDLAPKIIVGTSQLGSVLPPRLSSQSDCNRLFLYLDGLLNIGCWIFDTAASYQLGGTERLIGNWTKSRKNRDQLYLISKGAHPYPLIRPNRLNPAAIASDLHASLRRLQTEHLDLYLLHKDHPRAPLEPILEVFTKFQKQGKIKAWGVSNWSHSRIAAMNQLARKSGLPPMAASSPHFSLASWIRMPWSQSVSLAGEENQDERAYYEKEQLSVLAWSPLGHGFFSNWIESKQEWNSNAETLRVYGSPANFQRRERAQALAQKYNVSCPQIALAYLFHQKFPVFAVVSASTVEKMKKNLEATRLRLLEDEVRWLEDGRNPSPEEILWKS